MGQDPALDPTVFAYLAGIIDSDGFITINRSVRNGKPYYGAVIGISGTRTQPHELASSIWGGKVIGYEPRNPRHRTQFQWQRQGDGAVAPILCLQPYLRVKTEQARIALQAQRHVIAVRGGRLDPNLPAEHTSASFLEALRAEMIYVLNQGRRIQRSDLDTGLAPSIGSEATS